MATDPTPFNMWFVIKQKFSETGWYKISVSARLHCWIMEQDKDMWDWPSKEYSGTNFVNVSSELLFVMKLTYTEIGIKDLYTI